MNRGEHTAILQRIGGVRAKLHLWHSSAKPLCGVATSQRSDVDVAPRCSRCEEAWYRRTRDVGRQRTTPGHAFLDERPRSVLLRRKAVK